MKTISAAIAIGLVAAVIFPARAEDTNQAVTADMALMQGDWSMVSGTANGEVTPPEAVGTMKRVCKGDEAAVTRGGQLVTRAKFTIDPSAKPKTIDYKTIEGPTAGRTLLGIYELDGDTVKFCFGAPGGARPAEFVSKPGDRRTLTVWKRARNAPAQPAGK